MTTATKERVSLWITAICGAIGTLWEVLKNLL